jgi:alkylmercury lyase
MNPTVEELAAALVGAFLQLTAAEQRLVVAIYRLLSQGRPVATKAIADGAEWSLAEVETRLESWPGVFRGGGGHVVGFWGLATEQVSAHQLQVADGGTVWAWCAFDPLFIAPLLGREVAVTSQCPATGETVRLILDANDVRDLHPATVVSFLMPRGPFDADIRQTFCLFVHFLASPAAADDWTAGHPETFWVPMPDAIEVARLLTASVFPTIGAEPTV